MKVAANPNLLQPMEAAWQPAAPLCSVVFGLGKGQCHSASSGLGYAVLFVITRRATSVADSPMPINSQKYLG